ncbi:phosphatidylinositol phosphatase PTPRQ-like isoform X2 [Mya arenaria]|uniref:phosphatidylinositol phosphatase PTPRQ-like isoform X2 n=1 Tax=Mya arenaria TaxID=6604 RepID=UPI0022E552A8|nr:phosphatidylinositol phosphatase PTPRQ-like isoform X2 [Mya arenaria]
MWCLLRTMETVHYFALLVNLVSLTRSCHGLGQTCTVNPSNCTCTGEVCLGSNTCVCDSEHYTANGGCTETQLQVTSITFSQVDTTSMIVSWTPPSGKSGFIYDYKVQWRSNDNTIVGGVEDNIMSTTTSITGLTPGKNYLITVTSVNRGTQTDSPRTASLFIQKSSKPMPPRRLDLGSSNLDASDQRVTLVWTAPSSGVVSGYSVEVLDGNESKQSISNVGTASATLSFSDIKNGNVYNVKIISKSETYAGSNTEPSDTFESTFKTVVQVPDPPTDVSCQSIYDEYITLSWTVPLKPNGDLDQYVVHTLSYPSNTEKFQNNTISTGTTYNVHGLEPGTAYVFRVYTQNEGYKSTEYGAVQTFCTTKARMADKPQNLNFVNNITSRALSVTWSEPVNIYSSENLGYIVQLQDNDASMCAKEIIMRCSNCTTGDINDIDMPHCGQNLQVQIDQSHDVIRANKAYTFQSLLPDTNYTVSVTVVQIQGRGYAASINMKTLEEEPQAPPVVKPVVDIGKTSFNVSWSLIGPRPGQVTYTVILTADMGADSKKYNVTGYLNNSWIADGLEEYWNYTVSVKAITNVGCAKTSDITQKYRTLHSAPGAVTDFEAVKAEQRSDNFHKMTIRWKAPSLLERNSDIKEYVLKHNVGNIATNSGVGGELKTMSFTSETGDGFYSQEFDVIPESTYHFEVYAVNTKSTDNIGVKMTINEMAPAGFPVNIEEADATLQVVKEGSKDKTFISLNLVRDYFTEETNGRVQRTALLGCKSSACPENFLDYADTQEKVDVLANWQKAALNGLYRITSADWLTKNKRRRRSTYTNVTYTVGTESCDGVPEGTYCNGPLEPGTEYIIVAVVCTSTGCTVSKKYGPFITKEADPQPVGMIVGKVVGVIAILAIAVVVVFILRRYRNKTPTINKEHGVGIEINTDSVSTKDGIRLIVYENVISGNQAAGPNYNTVNISGCWPEKDYKLCFNPTIDKVNQFWTMIFEEAVYTIVMFAESKAHKKESRYWPSDFNEPTNYGHVDLEVTYLNTHNAYTHMKINICNRLTTRTVNHFQCAPVSTFSPDGFVYFVKCVRSNVKTGRILLQSSKGLASTVPFVVLDTCLQQLSDGALAEKVDVYKMLVNMAKTRKDLMPPRELFIFTHDCVQRLGTGDYEPLQNTAQIESVYQTLQVDD